MLLLSVMSQVKLVSFTNNSSSRSSNNNRHIPVLRNFRGGGSRLGHVSTVCYYKPGQHR